MEIKRWIIFSRFLEYTRLFPGHDIQAELWLVR